MNHQILPAVVSHFPLYMTKVAWSWVAFKFGNLIFNFVPWAMYCCYLILNLWTHNFEEEMNDFCWVTSHPVTHKLLSHCAGVLFQEAGYCRNTSWQMSFKLAAEVEGWHCRPVGPPLWSGLKNLDKYWMDYQESLYWHSWSPEDESVNVSVREQAVRQQGHIREHT